METKYGRDLEKGIMNVLEGVRDGQLAHTGCLELFTTYRSFS